MMKNLRRLRIARGLTQGEIAELVGVTASTVSQWEGGGFRPDDFHLMRLCEVFHVTPGFMQDVRRVARNGARLHLVDREAA